MLWVLYKRLNPGPDIWASRTNVDSLNIVYNCGLCATPLIQSLSGPLNYRYLCDRTHPWELFHNVSYRAGNFKPQARQEILAHETIVRLEVTHKDKEDGLVSDMIRSVVTQIIEISTICDELLLRVRGHAIYPCPNSAVRKKTLVQACEQLVTEKYLTMAISAGLVSDSLMLNSFDFAMIKATSCITYESFSRSSK